MPEVLLSGHHEEIRHWRLMQSLGRTKERRPGLLEGRPLTKEEAALLAEYARGPQEQNTSKSSTMATRPSGPTEESARIRGRPALHATSQRNGEQAA